MRFLSLFVFLLMVGTSGMNDAFAARLQCQTLPELFELYIKNHYMHSQLSDQIKTNTVAQFIKMLDPSKTTLLESDVEKIRQRVGALMMAGKFSQCAELDEAYDLLVARAKENEAFVRVFLGDSYKFDETVELVIDPDKRAYAKTEQERQELLKKMVHFQISNYILTDMKLPEAKKQLIHRYELITRRTQERKQKNGIEHFAEAFSSALDPHSSYLSQDDLQDFQIHMQLSLEGIGASLSSQDGFTVIEEVIPGGGADRSKMLKAQDKIVAVAQDGQKTVNVIDMDLQEVVRMIRGKKGTKVRLTILRQAETTESFDVTIVRDKIDIKEQAAKLNYEKRKVDGRDLKIAVIELPSFYGGSEKGSRSSYEDMKKLLAEAAKEKADGVLLNLSRNGGGLLDHAVRISGLFIREGAVVATQDTQKRVQVMADTDPSIVYPGPVVVLTSRLSASASEILAGALKDYKRAVIVGGDHTFGKGTVQVLSPLPFELGAMKVTTGMFFVPGGASTQHQGVASDIRLPSLFNEDQTGEKALDYSLPPRTIETFLSKNANSAEPTQAWKEVPADLIAKLAERSKQRVSKDAKFAEIQKDIQESQANQGIVRLADLKKKSAEEKKKNGGVAAKKAAQEKQQNIEAPFVNEGVNILVDLISLKS